LLTGNIELNGEEMTYECWSYKNGKPNKMVYVSASNKEEAITLVW